MQIELSGGKSVCVRYKDLLIATDHPLEHGGQGAAPESYALCLASLGTRAGFYVLAFCQSRNLPTQGINLTQRMLPNP